jgi:glycerol-3-phosphate cytidylyltransferase-like family protein
MSKKVICISGCADPLHLGIIRFINAAAKYGQVVFLLNNDEWVKGRKGFLFMPQDERKEILLNIKGIHNVVISPDIDGTVSRALISVMPDFFGHGDKEYPIPELELCKEFNIQLLWELGGPKIRSSTEMIDGMINTILDTVDKNMVW